MTPLFFLASVSLQYAVLCRSWFCALVGCELADQQQKFHLPRWPPEHFAASRVVNTSRVLLRVLELLFVVLAQLDPLSHTCAEILRAAGVCVRWLGEWVR